MDKSNSAAISKIEKLYQAAMNARDSVRSFVGSEVLEDIYREQYFRAYRITHDVAQFAWETRQYRKFLRTHQHSAAPPLLPAQTTHGAVLHDGHYGPVHCHCSECDYLVDSAEAQLQPSSDPSGKGAEPLEWHTYQLLYAPERNEWWIGIEWKFGDGISHSVKTVRSSEAGAVESKLHIDQFMESVAASLRQQLSDSQELLDKVREEIKRPQLPKLN